MAIKRMSRSLEVPFPEVSPPQTSPLLPSFTRSAPGHRESDVICSGPPILKERFDSFCVQLLVCKIFLAKKKDHFTILRILISWRFFSHRKEGKCSLMGIWVNCPRYHSYLPTRVPRLLTQPLMEDRVLFNMLIHERKTTLCISLTPHSIYMVQNLVSTFLKQKITTGFFPLGHPGSKLEIV